MNNINDKEPTLSDVQRLNAVYSTIELKKNLYNNLNETLDSRYLDALSEYNVHQIYNHVILKYYPNEVSVKSTFINQVLLKGKSHISIFELPIVNSRADLCKINGESVVYEIKTDLDNFTRLSKQINDYKKVFDKVYVICSTNRLEQMKNHISKDIGIYTYRITKSSRYIYKLERKALKNDNLDNEEQLKVLWKKELRALVNNSIESKEEMIEFLLNTMDRNQINSIFKEQLKKRYQKKWDFFKENHEQLLEIDYQWFYKNTFNPEFIYH